MDAETAYEHYHERLSWDPTVTIDELRQERRDTAAWLTANQERLSEEEARVTIAELALLDAIIDLVDEDEPQTEADPDRMEDS